MTIKLKPSSLVQLFKGFLLLAAFVFPSNSSAQKLHTFLFCKTMDSEIGDAVRANYVNVREHFQMVANALEYEYVEHAVTGFRFSVEEIEKSINNAAIDTNDVVILYFSTHGSIPRKDTIRFPQVAIRNEFISAYQRHIELRKKKPKVLWTIIEACSAYYDLTPQQSFVFEPQFEKSVVPDILTTTQIKNIRNLFSSNQDFIITAGDPGKITLGTPTGSIFTNCLLRTMNELFSNANANFNSHTWVNLLEQARQYTYDETTSLNHSYSPIWDEFDPVTSQMTISNGTTADDLNVHLNVDVNRRWSFIRPYQVNLTVTSNDNSKIDKVIYFLDKTMPKPIDTPLRQDNFWLGMQVYGGYPIKAKIYFRDGRVKELFENLIVKGKRDDE